MNRPRVRCLILACGNTLREDDGVGPYLAAWAGERFRDDPRIRVLCDHQWTPEMVEEVAQAGSVIFVDCATDCAPGRVRTTTVEPAGADAKIGTHHLEAGQLLALSQQLYGSMPGTSLLLTVGAESIELREGFSGVVQAALPQACKALEKIVCQFIGAADSPQVAGQPE